VEARVYKCTDKEGNVTYNNSPSGCRYNDSAKEEAIRTYVPPASSDRINSLYRQKTSTNYSVKTLTEMFEQAYRRGDVGLAKSIAGMIEETKYKNSREYRKKKKSVRKSASLKEGSLGYTSGLDEIKRLEKRQIDLIKKKRELRRIENRQTFSDIDRRQQYNDWNRKNKEIKFH